MCAFTQRGLNHPHSAIMGKTASKYGLQKVHIVCHINSDKPSISSSCPCPYMFYITTKLHPTGPLCMYSTSCKHSPNIIHHSKRGRPAICANIRSLHSNCMHLVQRVAVHLAHSTDQQRSLPYDVAPNTSTSVTSLPMYTGNRMSNELAKEAVTCLFLNHSTPLATIMLLLSNLTAGKSLSSFSQHLTNFFHVPGLVPI
jgi:hypothetical protein